MSSLLKVKKIAVHDFVFHADDVVSVALVYTLYRAVPLTWVSSRDTQAQENLRQGGYILIDVGGGEFDHHSIDDINGRFAYPNGVHRSAVGKVLDAAVSDGKLTAAEAEMLLMQGLYSLQAGDSGQDFGGVPSPFEFIKWINEDPTDVTAQMEAFEKALNISLPVLKAMIKDAKASTAEHELFANCAQKMGDDGIVDLPHHINHGVLECQIWNSNPKNRRIRFFTFDNGRVSFMIQAVNKVASFDLEEALPFKGLRSDDLNNAAGIPDGVFVHPNGFIGCADSLESCHRIANFRE